MPDPGVHTDLPRTTAGAGVDEHPGAGTFRATASDAHADGHADAESEGAWSVAERLARTLRVPHGSPTDLVSRVAAEAVDLVAGARSCGVLVTGPQGDLEVVATTDRVPRRLDDLQQQLGAGPCLTAARKQIVVRMHDLTDDARWPRFRETALELGVTSMLCLPLYVDRDVLGTLSLYSPDPGAFRVGAEPVARLLAALAAVALAETRLAEQLRAAMRSRDLIGQAKGILMREHRITADEAFARLRRRSQHTNTKLLDVARLVAETGTLDEDR